MNHSTAGIVSSPVRWARQTFSYRPFLFLLAAGVFIRVFLMIAYSPAVMMSFDSPRFARTAGMPMFGDFWMPAGYPMLLHVLHAISEQLRFTIAAQHVMGLGVGLLLFAAMRHLGIRESISSLAAAVPLLSGDHLYLEHLVTADNFMTFLTAAGLAAAVRGLVPNVNLAWIAIASAFLAMAALARSVGLILVPVLAVCALFWVWRPRKQRALAQAASLLPGMGVFLLYAGACLSVHGQYLGLRDMSGWHLYARVAPFADCSKFQPPAGTQILCEERAPADRPGPMGYEWDLTSVPRVKFELGPESSRKLGKFGLQVLKHQPVDYVHAVVVDLARFFVPSFAARPYSGQGPELISFGWRDKEVEKIVVRALSEKYPGTKVHARRHQLLGLYQNIFCVRGTMIFALTLFSVLGMVKARGSLRLGVFLFGLAAFGLYLVPVLTFSYDFRYGIPPSTFLVVSGLLGVASLWPRLCTARACNPIVSEPEPV